MSLDVTAIRAPGVALAVASVVGAAGCATDRRTISFATAGFDEEAEGLLPPPMVRAQPRAEDPVVEAGPEAARLDASLVRFAAQARILRSRAPAEAEIPDVQVRAWADLFVEIDEFLAQPAARTPVLTLMRAQVTLDAEVELDRRRWGVVPVDLAEGARERQSALLGRMPEARRLAARARPPALAWPVAPVLVTSLFGDRVDPFLGEWRRHQGIDLAGERRQLVTAAAPGMVVRAERTPGHGLHVEVEHPDGATTRYSHLSQALTVPGARLHQGDPVGLVGRTGRATGPHLHFEVWRNGRPVDPLGVLGQPAAPPRRAPEAAGLAGVGG